MLVLFALLVAFAPVADAAPYDIPLDAPVRYPAIDYAVPDLPVYELVPEPAPIVLPEPAAEPAHPRTVEVARPTVEARAAVAAQVLTREG